MHGSKDIQVRLLLLKRIRWTICDMNERGGVRSEDWEDKEDI